MRWFERFRVATLMLFRRQQQTVRLNDELRFHLDQQVKENIARGLSPEEAHYAALRTFGNPALLRDQARSSWSWNWPEKFLRDLRYGVRTLTRSPGFALTAILVMALGIGATTSLFTIVRAVLLKPLPFRDPDKLVMVYEHFRTDTEGDGFNIVASADFNDWHKRTHGFENMAAWRITGFDLTGEHAELPEVVEAAGGSWDLFSLVGTPLALGRAFTQQDDQRSLYIVHHIVEHGPDARLFCNRLERMGKMDLILQRAHFVDGGPSAYPGPEPGNDMTLMIVGLGETLRGKGRGIGYP